MCNISTNYSNYGTFVELKILIWLLFFYFDYLKYFTVLCPVFGQTNRLYLLRKWIYELKLWHSTVLSMDWNFQMVLTGWYWIYCSLSPRTGFAVERFNAMSWDAMRWLNWFFIKQKNNYIVERLCEYVNACGYIW